MVAIAQIPTGLAWLPWLDDELWGGQPNGSWFPNRKLSEDELERVFALVNEHNLALELCCTNFGFSIGFRVFQGGGFPGVPPKQLLVVGADCIRGSERGAEAFDMLWTLLTPHTHSDKNRERCRSVGIPEPREKGHYVY